MTPSFDTRKFQGKQTVQLFHLPFSRLKLLQRPSTLTCGCNPRTLRRVCVHSFTAFRNGGPLCSCHVRATLHLVHLHHVSKLRLSAVSPLSTAAHALLCVLDL